MDDSFLRYRKQIALVAQEPTLFATTIRENIALGGEFTEDVIERAAKNANAHGFITGFQDV
jgi:ABC-type multidrug transport system fused ATPase/permease subunit